MAEIENILARQKRWSGQKPRDKKYAQARKTDDVHYLESYGLNLFQPLCPNSHEAFSQGDGGELKDKTAKNGRYIPAKMKSLLSSSALAVNIFEYWHQRLSKGEDVEPLLQALKSLGYDLKEIKSIHFEKQFPIIDTKDASLRDDFPKDPNIDIVIEGLDFVLAIESKFTEPYGSHVFSIRDAYISKDNDVRRSFELRFPQLYAFATGAGLAFKRLDWPQLTKHFLGLENSCEDIYKKKYQLALFWYKEPKAPRTQSDKPKKMDDEIREFSNIAEIKDKFSATTYQDFFEDLKTTCCGLSEHDEYITYLRDRYFPQNN